jgi:antirestriction protein ArdC
MKKDLYETITSRILDALDKGTVPWRMPWRRANGDTFPISISTGKHYRGMNCFLLQLSAHVRGFENNRWVTFNQAKALGGGVRKGAKGELVVFWKKWEVKDATAKDGKKTVPVLRYFNVFNASEVDGLPARFIPAPVEITPHDSIGSAEAIVSGMPQAPVIRHEGGRAFYRPATDIVTMPERGRFNTGEEYYSTLFHELAHASGHESRLNRLPSKNETGFIGGEGEYAREELVAEMTSAFLCAESGISPAVIENQAAYLDGWRRKLRADTKAVVVAAGQAQRAADFILARTWNDKPAEAAAVESTEAEPAEALAV